MSIRATNVQEFCNQMYPFGICHVGWLFMISG